MIQRIQSVWLLLATFTLVLMIFLPIATKDVNGSDATVYTTGLHQIVAGKTGKVLSVDAFLPLLILNIVIAIMCFINIFNFKKRTLQKRILIITIVAIGGFAFWCSVHLKELPGGSEGATFGIGAYMPALAILFCVLAIFGINKDERLIRSAERLR
ncbi:DUF4293 domain-containing protein [Pedobacter nototheniae]|uniref:DUF4293 domain-containing protein n=1 Tax=Pedobacter nototheniae TaxID=2488994 RepID=UPI00103A7603|nr:DUF4293 domain-containing protein [Pedobacter nototheniae]